MPKYRQIYAVYRGDDNLGDGTAEEIAEKLNITPGDVRVRSTPCYHKRAINGKGKRLIIIKLGKEEV
ncbi:hypothetical protein IFE17_02820 [Actinobacillus sp. GY-402]|nr:hypothetical protein IFE17_02820 [Actinobacillus sp. GY-402]